MSASKTPTPSGGDEARVKKVPVGAWVGYGCLVLLLLLGSCTVFTVGKIKSVFGKKSDAQEQVSGATAPAAKVTPVVEYETVQVVVALPDCTTPCRMEIKEISDIYSDGVPIWMLPPGWSRDRAIRYEGRGKLVIQGGNIRSGTWEFWPVDPSRTTLVRAFEHQTQVVRKKKAE